MLKASNFSKENIKINDVELVVTTYQVGDLFHCHVENKDPGATIARSEGPTREAAREKALARARERLQ